MIQTEITAGFSAPASGYAGSLLIDSEPATLFYGHDEVPLRLFPAVPAKLFTTRGSVRVGGYDTLNVEQDGVLFSGSDSASLSYPASRIAGLRVLYAVDLDGNPASPSFFYDMDNQVFRASVPCHAALVVDYEAAFIRLMYTPELIGGGVAVGMAAIYGEVFAFYQGASTSYQVPAPTLQKEENWAEYYRVYSVVVTDPDGVWERPPNWPDDGSYPGHPDGPDPDNSKDDEVVSEVGYLRNDGFGNDQKTYYRPIYKPYEGRTYTPQYKLRRRDPPDGFEDAFRAVDWSSLLERLRHDYPGLTE